LILVHIYFIRIVKKAALIFTHLSRPNVQIINNLQDTYPIAKHISGMQDQTIGLIERTTQFQ
jgi:hypothetical protein